jgi:hypothetical protein
MPKFGGKWCLAQCSELAVDICRKYFQKANRVLYASEISILLTSLAVKHAESGNSLTAAKNNTENTIGSHQLPSIDRNADLADSASPETFWC